MKGHKLLPVLLVPNLLSLFVLANGPNALANGWLIDLAFSVVFEAQLLEAHNNVKFSLFSLHGSF